MRIGQVRPGIYGVGYIGLGDQDPGSRLDKIFNDHLKAAMLGQYGDPPPDAATFGSALAQEVSLLCANVSFTTPCPPASAFQPMVDAYVSNYAQWLMSYRPGSLVYAQPTTGGLAPTVTPYTQTPQPVPAITVTPGPNNALDRAAPTATNVTPSPAQNGLTPPQQKQPMSGQNDGSFTGSENVDKRPGDMVSIGGFDIPTWAILGAAVAGLYLVMKGKH